MIYEMPWQGRWLVFTDEQLAAIKANPDPAKAKLAEWFLYQFHDVYKKNPLSHFLAHSGGLDFINDWTSNVAILWAGNQQGKALSLDTRLVTPTGWKLMRDIRVGDVVIGGDGKPCNVTGVYDQGPKDCYRFHFDNGSDPVVCDKDHLWVYLPHKHCYKDRPHLFNKWITTTARDIVRRQKESSTPQTRGLIPNCGPVEYTSRSHILHPYLVGCLLGDGSLSANGAVSFSSADKEIVDRLKTLLPDNLILRHDGKYGFRLSVSDELRQHNVRSGRRNVLVAELSRLGLLGTDCFSKFVPAEYLMDSSEHRLELLRGLMDTDGTIGDVGAMEFCTVSGELANAVRWLVLSLGGKVKIRTRRTSYTYKGEMRHGALSYRVIVKMHGTSPFWLPRKSARWYPIGRRPEVRIMQTEDAGKHLCRCITCDSPDHTFLVNDFIVTHNSAALIAKLAFRAIPNNPDWHCFKHHKIAPLKWNGPVRLAVNTYEWMHHKRNLWPAICKFLPIDELREYHPDWNGPMSRRKRKEPSWNQTPTCKLLCGTIIDFYCCRQPPECFESVPYDFWANDEQQTEQIFDAQWSRGSSKKQFQIGIACTPHKVQGRTDTGAGGFIAKMYKGIETKGLNIGRHIINVDEVPDVVMPPKTRAENFHKYITYPMQTGNQKAIREGRSRWYGEPESGEGLVYDNWLPQIHFIEPFDIPPHWTRFRSVDPGRVAPTAVLWGAMSQWGDLVLYREYYEAGLGIADNARRIVEASGNQLRIAGKTVDAMGNALVEYEEVKSKEDYLFTVMDGRTFKQPSNETGTTLGYVWARAGLRCVPASGMRNSEAIPIVKEWLEIRTERQHILVRMKKADKIIGAGGVAITGAPRLYVFQTLHNFRKEIETYSNKEDNSDEPADRQEDHLMTALKYLVLAEPRYTGPLDRENQKWHLDQPLAKRGKKRYEYHL